MKKVQLNPFDVVIVKSSGFVSKLIMWRSLSKWSHSFMIKNATGESYNIIAKGVIRDNIYSYKKDHIAICRYKELRPRHYKQVGDWCESTMKQSKGYDFKGLFGFVIFKPSTEDSERWFCSEYCYNAFQLNGLPITNQYTKFPYPSLFYRNPKFNILAEGKLNKDFEIII